MKRDMDLIRDLLLILEGLEVHTNGVLVLSGGNDEVAVPNYSPEQIGYHLVLIRDAGFLKDVNFKPMRGGVSFSALSWEGHDYLDSVRDAEVWKKTKDTLDAAGGFTIDLAKALAKGFIKKKIAQLTDVEIEI